jgi:hypothetical protein
MLQLFFARNVGIVLSQKPVLKRCEYFLCTAGALNGINSTVAKHVTIVFTARR